MAAAIVSVALSTPASAEAAKGLPDGWILGELPAGPDGKARWTYREPAPRRGTVLHGDSGEITDAPE